MKRTYKSLLLLFSIFFLTAFSAIDMKAQSTNSGFEGTWILDSVQVKEVGPDNIVEKTVLPDEDYEFNNIWMHHFTLDANGKASYKEKNDCIISDIPFSIEDIKGNTATLIINGVDYKVLNVQLLSDKKMLINHSLTTGDEILVINVFLKIYYHKSNK